MKSHVVGLFVGVFLVMVFAPAFASGSLNGKTKNTSASKEVGNKICPVSGQPVGTMGDIVKHEHNGKIYNLCCPACTKDFSKDPEKYSKIAEG